MCDSTMSDVANEETLNPLPYVDEVTNYYGAAATAATTTISSYNNYEDNSKPLPSTKFCAHERIFVQRPEGELVAQVSRSRQLMLWGELAEKRFMREYIDLSSFDVEVLRRQLSAIVGYAYGSFDYIDYLRIRDNFTTISRLFLNSVFTAKYRDSVFRQLHSTLLSSQLAGDTRELFTELAKTRSYGTDESTALKSSPSTLLYADMTATLVYRIRLNKPYDSNCSRFLANPPIYASNINTILHSDRIVNVCDNNIREFEEFAFGSRVISHINDHNSFTEYFQQNTVYALEDVVLDADELNNYFDHRTNVDDGAIVDGRSFVEFSSNAPWQLRLAKFLHDCRRSGVILESNLLESGQRHECRSDPAPPDTTTTAATTTTKTTATLSDPLEETDRIAVTAFLLNVLELVDPHTNQRHTYDLSFVPKYNKLNLQMCVLDNIQQRRHTQQLPPTERAKVISSDTHIDNIVTDKITTTNATVVESGGDGGDNSDSRLRDYAVRNVYDRMMENTRRGVTLLTSANIANTQEQHHHQQHQKAKTYKTSVKALSMCSTPDCDKLTILETRVSDDRSNIVDQQTLPSPTPFLQLQRVPSDDELIAYYNSVDVKTLKRVDPAYRAIFYTFPFKAGHYVNASTCRIVYINVRGSKFVNESLQETLALIYYNWSSENLYAVLEQSAKRLPYEHVLGAAINTDNLEVLAALLMLVHAQMGAKISITTLSTNVGKHNAIHHRISVRIPYINELYRWVKIHCGKGENVSCSMYNRMSNMNWSLFENEHNHHHHHHHHHHNNNNNNDNNNNNNTFDETAAAGTASGLAREKHNVMATRISFPFVSDECKKCKFYQNQLAYFADLIEFISTHVYSTWDCVLLCSRYSIPEYLYQDLHEIAVSSSRKLYVLLTIIVQDTNYELYRAYRANTRVNWRVNVDKYSSETRTVIRQINLNTNVATVADESATERDIIDYLFPENARTHNVTTRTQTRAEYNTVPIVLPVEFDSDNRICVMEKRDFYSYRFADERLEHLVLNGNAINGIDTAEQSVMLAQLYHSWKSRKAA